MIIVCFSLKAQQTGNVEKSIFNFQFGTVGAWLSNEAKLLDNLALRTEIGLYTEIVSGNGFFIAPEITFEPRWYYNISKRFNKKLDISNNSANFFTIKTSYRSNIFEITHNRGKGAEKSISFVPKWGIRRNLGNLLNYEAGLGVGYLTFFNQKYFTQFDSDGLILELHLRIGLNL
tara:strand:+ start:1689 stop:2213 length:525 start_codon:yes stop_codon:yes gene_type:complete